MGLPSYETIEKLLFPENKKQKSAGCVLLLFITNGIIYAILKEVTWVYFFQYYLRISITLLFGFNIWYVVYYFIRKRRLKPLKEIYESYYWLVTRLEPFFLLLPEGEERPAYLDSLVPAYFKSLKEHLGDSMPFQEYTADAFFKDYATTNELGSDLKPFYNWVFTTFSEHVKKGMCCLHIKGGDEIPILNLTDLKRLYEKEGLEWDTTAYSNPGRLVDYFNEEHLQNLKKLSDC